jgi:polysaccharide biosynthesis/export protein
VSSSGLPIALLVVAALPLLTGCPAIGKFVWVDDYPIAPAAEADGYVLAPGDLVWVRVFNQDAMSARGRVRPDGKLAVPFLNDVEMAGYTCQVLGAQLQTRMKEFINNPVVTVTLEEPRQLNVAVLGEVQRPGRYPLEVGAGVLEALAAAGGTSEFFHPDRIYVLRPSKNAAQAPSRVRFHWQKLARAEGKAPSFRLEGGDTVVVE